MDVFEIIGAVIGLFYIVSEYRADRWFWPLSLLMSAFYAVIDFTSGIYANGAICCYNFVMSVYGLLVWRGILWPTRPQDFKTSRLQDLKTSRPQDFKTSRLQDLKTSSQQDFKTTSQRVISSCPRRYWWQIVTVIALLSVVLTWLLSYIRESSYPLLDGVSSALTIVGMLMLAHKWWQQWFCWMLVEPLMIALFLLTGNYASAVLYAVFEVFCILGILRWRKESLDNA